MKLVTAADVWYTQQQKTLDEIAEKLGVVAYRPSYHGAERDKNTVLFYLKEDEEHNLEVDRQPVRYSRSEAKDRGVNVNSECVYEDADIPAEACVEYRKFEDELIRDGMSLQHVLDLLKAEKEGRLKVRPESLGQCCGQCHHFLREPMKASGICEVRKNKHYPRAGTPLYCCQSKKACLDFDERGERPIRYQEA